MRHSYSYSLSESLFGGEGARRSSGRGGGGG